MIKVLSIMQPWAWLICHAADYRDPKRVENRSWSTRHRGRLLIHTGKVADREAYPWIKETRPDVAEALAAAAGRGELNAGGIVGVCELRDCWRVESPPAGFDPHGWAFGPWCFELRQARPLPFRAMAGSRGIYEINPAAWGLDVNGG